MWCKKMSYPASKMFRQPLWVLLVASLFLVGCEDDGDSSLARGESGSDQETAEVEDGNGQGATSESGNFAQLTWQAPVQRENGDSLKDGEISHYLVRWGQDPQKLEQTTEVSCASCQDMEYRVEDLEKGDWYFSVQTVDTDGNVSRRADPVNKTI